MVKILVYRSPAWLIRANKYIFVHRFKGDVKEKSLSFDGFFPPFSLAGSPPHDLQIMVCSCIIPCKSVFAANNILLMHNSNHARSLWSLLCEMADHDRFPKLSESELTSLLDQKNSDNTKKATKVALNVFRDYLKERQIDEDSLVASEDKLATVLRNFYVKPEKRMVSFTPKLHLSGYALAFSGSSAHTRLISSKTPSFLKPTQFIKRKFQRLNRKGKLTHNTNQR